MGAMKLLLGEIDYSRFSQAEIRDIDKELSRTHRQRMLTEEWQSRACPTGIIAHDAIINGRRCLIHQGHDVHAMVKQGRTRFSPLLAEITLPYVYKIEARTTIVYRDDIETLNRAKRFCEETASKHIEIRQG